MCVQNLALVALPIPEIIGTFFSETVYRALDCFCRICYGQTG